MDESGGDTGAGPDCGAVVLLRLPSSDCLRESELRRMGLKPERVSHRGTVDAGFAQVPVYRIGLGSSDALIGGSGTDMVAAADPACATISSVGIPPVCGADDDAVYVTLRNHVPDGTASGMANDREYMTMLGLLIDLLQPTHIFWSPAGLWSEAGHFRAAIGELLISGMAPVLHLVAFRQSVEGGVPTLRTRGLAYFTGQELHFAFTEGEGQRSIIRGLARIALDMMINGPMDRARDFDGFDPGEVWTVEPHGSADLWVTRTTAV